MLQDLTLFNVLFLDIETVPLQENFEDLTKSEKELYEQKTQYLRKDKASASEFYHRAGIWAEFGRIVCISVGYFVSNTDKRQFRVTSFYGEEFQLLKDFKDLLERHYYKPQHLLCAHNGKEFDFPFLARRMIINGIEPPKKLNLFGKKPWEIPHLDTLDLWKFGDYKHFTSLKLLTHVLGIPSPKDDIDGSQVKDVFYKEKDIDRIVSYCEKDTVAVAQIVLRLRQEKLLTPEEITQV